MPYMMPMAAPAAASGGINKPLMIVLLVCCLLAVVGGGVGFYLYKNRESEKTTTPAASTPKNTYGTTAPAATAPSNTAAPTNTYTPTTAVQATAVLVQASDILMTFEDGQQLTTFYANNCNQPNLAVAPDITTTSNLCHSLGKGGTLVINFIAPKRIAKMVIVNRKGDLDRRLFPCRVTFKDYAGNVQLQYDTGVPPVASNGVYNMDSADGDLKSGRVLCSRVTIRANQELNLHAVQFWEFK